MHRRSKVESELNVYAMAMQETQTQYLKRNDDSLSDNDFQFEEGRKINVRYITAQVKGKGICFESSPFEAALRKHNKMIRCLGNL